MVKLHVRTILSMALIATLATGCSAGGFAGGGGGKGGEKKIDKPSTQPQTPTKPSNPNTEEDLGNQTPGEEVPADKPKPSKKPNTNDEVVVPSQVATPKPTPAPTPAPTSNPVPPSQPVPPSNPIPPSEPDDEQTSGQLHVPVTAFVNMEHGYHGTDECYVAQLVDGSGVLAAGPATIEAARNGQATDGSGAYPGIVMNFDMTYVRAATAGSGTINVCLAECGVAPEQGQCKQVQGVFGPDGERPTSIVGQPATWTVSQEGGKPNFRVSGNYNLSTHHPVWAFAAPGKGFKDFQSPIVLDLDKNGAFDLTDVWSEKTVVRYDLNGEGKKVRTGWVAPTDALLALDVDANGTIDNGLELFGEYTKNVGAKAKPVAAGEKTFQNGFQALAQYDADGNGTIDAKDATYAKLVVWRDRNQDGVSQKSELRSLKDAGVLEISLAYVKSGNVRPLIVKNNEVRLVSTYKTADGKEHGVADVWFKPRRYSDKTMTSNK